jgi:hypothetical protein
MMNCRNKIFAIHLIVFSLFCFFSYSCNNSSLLETPLKSDSNYPTTIPVLSTDDLQQLQNEFEINNNHELNIKLNKYGFIGHESMGNPDYKSQIILSSDAVKELVVNTLLKNKKYTNTTDELTTLASITRVWDLDNSIQWRVDLGLQKSHNIEILKSNITVYICGGKVYCIYDSWYPNVVVPQEEKIDTSTAKTKVIGQILNISGFYPYGSKFTVTEKSIGRITDKVIFPFEKENSMELRVVWKIPIIFDDSLCWYIYLDTTTGEILGTKQLIIFN